MSELTKEELQWISSIIGYYESDGGLNLDERPISESVCLKLQSMIDNFCEHHDTLTNCDDEIISEKQIMRYIPMEVVLDNAVSFYVADLSVRVDAENWPTNLIYNPELIKSDETFYEQFCSDTTMYFYIESAINICRSLISRSTHQSNVKWEHGPIRILEIEGNCPEHYMTRTRTEVAIRKLNDN